MVDPGSIFSLLTNIIELSKRSEEHNDELKELHQNSEILLSLMKELESTNLLPDSIKEDVLKDLSEAKKFLESPEITNWSQKILIGVMGFLPGNKTSQLKEKNEKIYRHIHRIKALVDVKITKNALSTSAIFKCNSNPDALNKTTDAPLPETHTLKRTKTETMPSFDCFEATLNQKELLEPTLKQGNIFKDEVAYEIVWEGDKEIFQQYLSGNMNFSISETLKFQEVKEQLINSNIGIKEIFSVGRGKFMTLIKDKSETVRAFLSLISGNHLKLWVQKIEVAIEEKEKDKEKEKEKGDEKEKDKKDGNSAEKATLFFTCDDGNATNFEEKKKEDGKKYHYDFEFYVEDTSTNGSYILKEKKDAWERLPSKTRQLIQSGDKIGIVMDGKTHQMLQLGFLFRKVQVN